MTIRLDMTIQRAMLVAASLFCMGAQAANEIDQLSVRGEWVRTSESPLSPRNGANIAWTGSEILVFGGDEYLCPPAADCVAPSSSPFTDGAIYNPLTDSWREISDAPIGNLSSEIAIVGNDLFILTYPNYSERSIHLLRYQTTLDIWDEIEMPETMATAVVTSFSRGIVLYSATDEYGPVSDWYLNTNNGRWIEVPDDPLGPGFNRHLVALGDDLYLFDHALVPSPGGASGPSYLRAARFRGLKWEVLPASDSIGSAPSLIAGSQIIFPRLGCADGGGTNGFGRCIEYGAVFDTATDTWHELPDAPGRGIKSVNSSGGISDTDLVLFRPGYPALDAVANEWFIVPQLDSDRNTQRSIRAAGPYGFAFGGSTFSRFGGGKLLNEAWIWVP